MINKVLGDYKILCFCNKKDKGLVGRLLKFKIDEYKGDEKVWYDWDY